MVPQDSCPYRRPFEPYFRECPLYKPELFVANNTRDLPLAAVWTCHHLTVGEYEGQRGHLYARCLFGDGPSRRHALFEALRGPEAA